MLKKYSSIGFDEKFNDHTTNYYSTQILNTGRRSKEITNIAQFNFPQSYEILDFAFPTHELCNKYKIFLKRVCDDLCYQSNSTKNFIRKLLINEKVGSVILEDLFFLATAYYKFDLVEIILSTKRINMNNMNIRTIFVDNPSYYNFYSRPSRYYSEPDEFTIAAGKGWISLTY